MASPRFSEDTVSQFPALHLLMQMGWKYLKPQETLELRDKRLSNVLLEPILEAQLKRMNRIGFKGQEYDFSETSIKNAIQALKEVTDEGLIKTNENIYDLLTLGKSLQQNIDGDQRSFSLHYIDWNNIENNVFHVTQEFEVEGLEHVRRPDLVLFVNGIPLCVIECKSPHIKNPMNEAISQMIRNQKEDEIPRLFHYAQLLLAVSTNEAKYGTVGTDLKFWSVWKEKENREALEAEVQKLTNTQLSAEEISELTEDQQWSVREEVARYGVDERLITEQSKSLYALCHPKRLLEMTQRFILFDAGIKKIARYQQYFAVKKLIERIKVRDRDGRRRGGVVWHTQGSGKSLTMVMLAKAIAMEPGLYDHKMILVTDRVDLDNQIRKTFQNTGHEPHQAKTGKDLAEQLMSPKSRVITTIIDKFEAAIGPNMPKNTGADIFVLVDEGHRGQYGPRHAKMRRALPNACYIGFTGTPVMKKDKDTVDKFGGLIDTYTIDQAEADGAIVPLIYEGRLVEQDVQKSSIDAWFERITKDLSEEQATDLKKKFASSDQINKAEQTVMRIAWDIGEHFLHWEGTGFKGQVVTPDKATALLFKKYLDEFGKVSSEVLISGPDDREGEESVFTENKSAVIRFWKQMMARYSNEKEYNTQIINAFKHASHPELIIVVDKLLTGFDAPRNTVLYLARSLKDHTLLQAIARVNRLHDGKDSGFIIDYRGVLENLSIALDMYTDLAEFDRKDLDGILTDISHEIGLLPQRHSDLLGVFKEIKNKRDVEAYEQLLADESIRDRFFENLSKFARTLSIALSSVSFHEKTPENKISQYRQDLKFFMKLRSSVKHRYDLEIDFGEYEDQIKNLVDRFVGAGDVLTITKKVNIFDKEEFQQEVEKHQSEAGKADTIVSRMTREIRERMDEDPIYYKKFSELIQQAIEDFRQKRIQANEYLRRANELLEKYRQGSSSSTPKVLQRSREAQAYFRKISTVLERFTNNADEDPNCANAGLRIDEIIKEKAIVNWASNIDIQNMMRTGIEDYLFELKSETGWEITFDDMDEIMDSCIDIAKAYIGKK